MNFMRTYTTDEYLELSSERLITYLVKVGFKTNHSDDCLIYKRGSFFGSLFSFSPKSWKTSIKIQLLPNCDHVEKVLLHLHINSFGQIVSQKERIYWQSEFKAIEIALCGESSDDCQATMTKQLPFKQNIKGLIFVVVITVVCGLFCKYFLRFLHSYAIGCCIGFLLGIVIITIYLKHNRSAK